MEKKQRKLIENYVKEKMGHTKADDAGTAFLRKHGYGPSGKKRGRIK